MPDRFETSTTLAARPEEVYRAWLDPRAHAAFVGSTADIDPGIGGTFEIFDGYISGSTLFLEPPRRIVQAWRTTEFPEGSPDSRLEILVTPEGAGTRLTLVHTEIPDGQGPRYEAGWEEHYFAPMREYFARRR